MFALDLFNTDHERRLTEGAVDQLEQRRIDDLAMKMDDLVSRAKQATTAEVKQALMKEFQKCKAERDSYYMVRNETMGYGTLTGEGQVTPTATGIRHHANPGVYGGFEKEKDPLAKLDKGTTNSLEKAMGIKFDRQKKYQGGLDVDEAGIPGNVPVEKIPGKEDLLKGKGRSYYEANQKKNSELDAARLAVGDPITVTAPNEFKGRTGEIYEFSPSGSFVIVDLYNHGKHSMHLSDVEYNQYADDQEQDDWYDEEMEEGYATAIGLNPKPLDTVSQWKISVRQLIADYIDNPQGLYNIAKQKGDNSAEAMAYKFIMHPKGKIDLPPDAVTFEGYQDFNRVEPYAVCLAGKPFKKFDYYEQARKFHDNWKQKLYREGNKAKADKITLMPLNLDEASVTKKPQPYNQNWTKDLTTDQLNKLAGPRYKKPVQQQGVKEAGNPAQQAAIAIAMKKAGKKPKSVDEGAMSNVHAAMADVYHRLAPKIERHRDSFLAGQLYDELENIAELHGIEPEFKRMMAGARNRAHMDYDTNPGGFQNWFWFLPFEDEVNEGLMKEPANRKEYLDQRDKLFRMMSMETNPANKQIIKQAITDLETRYSNMKNNIKEESSTSSEAVERAILNRIMVANTDLLMKFGPEKVMQAAEEVAYNVGDVDEIGTSDVSAYVNQVRQILGAE